LLRHFAVSEYDFGAAKNSLPMRKATTGAEARNGFGLYAALKRRSSTFVRAAA
jgi:hypothetical protein